eukprot:6829294-Prymnesium_polylepis.1
MDDVTTEELNLQASEPGVRDPPVVIDSGNPSGCGQDAAPTSPELAQPPTSAGPTSAALVGPIDKDLLTEAATEMYTGNRGAPAASTKPPMATEPSRELVIKCREVICTVFKSAGLASVRLTWGRLIDKREALYYLLGWALGRGLLPVTDRPHGNAGILGDKYWKWADTYESELADQKKAAGRVKSKLPAGEVEKHNISTSEARNRLLRAVIVLDLPSVQSCAAVKRHARPNPKAKPETIEPITYHEPDLNAVLAEAEAELSEASIYHQAASLKAERVTRSLAELLAVDPPPPPGPLRDAFLVGFEEKYSFGMKQMPRREEQRRAAAVRRLDDAQRRSTEAQLAEAEAHLAFRAAEVKATEARAQFTQRESMKNLAAVRLESGRNRGLLRAREQSERRALEASDARVASMEAQLAQLRVSLAAAEAAEQGVA